MSTLTIGRVGLDLSLDPVGFDLGAGSGGQTVGISGEVVGTQAEAISLRNELHRMLDLQNLIIPITFSTDDTLDGIYKVESLTMDVSAVGLNGFYPFYMRAKRMGSSGRIGIESRLIGGLRTNSEGVTTGTYEPWWGVPVAALSIDHGFTGFNSITRNAESGDVYIFRDADYTAPRWTVPATDFYDGAATVELGSTLRVRAGLDGENTPASWRLSNGFFRIGAGSPTTKRMSMAVYNGSGWEGAGNDMLVRVGGTEINDWDTVSIIRNEPQVCTLRFQEYTSELLTMDLTLRRGAAFVEGRLSRSAAAVFAVGSSAAEAVTSLTGGAQRSANDINGNRFVLGSPNIDATDFANGEIDSASVTEWSFMIGFALDGSGASAGNAAQDIVYQYFGYAAETQKAIIR